MAFETVQSVVLVEAFYGAIDTVLFEAHFVDEGLPRVRAGTTVLLAKARELPFPPFAGLKSLISIRRGRKRVDRSYDG